MAGGGCKVVLDSDGLSAIGRIADDSKAVRKLLDESENVWKISDACADLAAEVVLALKIEAQRDDHGQQTD